WRIQKREGFNFAQPKGLHPEDHLGQVGALDFRLGISGAREKVVLGVKPDTNPVLDTATAALSLISAALGNRFHRQTFGARAWIITADACQPGVNHIADPRNRQRSLGDIGGDYELATWGRNEHSLLVARAQSAVQRNNLRLFAEAVFQ